MNGVEDAKQQTAIQYIHKFIDETAPEAVAPLTKKPKLDNRFMEFRNTNRKHEFCDYRKYLAMEDEGLTILEFWKKNANNLPILSRLARKILSITPTSAPSERVFSLAGHIVSSRRTLLKAGSVNDMLLLHSQLDNSTLYTCIA